MNKEISIVIAGPRGKMGSEAVRMVTETPHFKLVAVIDSRNEGMKLKDVSGMPALDIPVYEDAPRCFSEIHPDVLIDLTKPDVGKIHLEQALEHNVRPVIGTTGFSDEDLERLKNLASERELGAIIAPNFAVGAVLMMKFAQMASRYLPDIEIIEKHHDQKLDAPSGTALKTAQLIREVRESKQQGHPDEREDIKGARGAELDGIRIHSIRLPGLVAHQEVVMGGEGQTLTIKHDSMNRASFMPGVKLAVEAVMNVDHLVYGLENIIE
ncbi:dihydrodipicolinate reductase [Fictibacillus enclensis]|uniref:4-hydroxy-tetrahydrodipicolinate reductase n=1 Tax=Fictibacillus enclensis TaxID=1017270 RepID=A0A0V8JEX1_9BACL|nr:4-hydroxy-tetrahydrodipicolinate reductase [Fictibacillus enclensis]KSU85563.1 4-hydroxy-tetrahydrodipicolinate reductase [Fictibacillus enclensis]SCB98917.1 dihydrodipicolinate reductase [Fictibacillus enclensis]